jgi:predicted nucleic acid-binding protein
MKIIVDTSRIIAALIKNSYSRTILLSDKLEFLTINLTKSEIGDHSSEILEKARISKEEFDDILSLVLRHIQIVSDLAIESKLDEARDIMQAIDPDDVMFVAAALAVENEGIWSDDNNFHPQKKIRIFNTVELFEVVKK